MLATMSVCRICHFDHSFTSGKCKGPSGSHPPLPPHQAKIVRDSSQSSEMGMEPGAGKGLTVEDLRKVRKAFDEAKLPELSPDQVYLPVHADSVLGKMLKEEGVSEKDKLSQKNKLSGINKRDRKARKVKRNRKVYMRKLMRERRARAKIAAKKRVP